MTLPNCSSEMMRCMLALVLLFAGTNGATAQSAPAEPPCGSAEHRQFDFWVGEWDVFATGTSKQVATSRIEKLHGGCTIRENWMPTSNPGGGSLTDMTRATDCGGKTGTTAAAPWSRLKAASLQRRWC